MKENDFIIKHIGEGKFECHFPDGTVKEAGPNIIGIIRFTYFENFIIPELGWETTRLTLLKDYNHKLTPEFGSHLKRMGRTEVIKKLKNNL